MKQIIKNITRKIFWTFFQKDFLVLNPTLSRYDTKDSIIFFRDNVYLQKPLSVKYNYHISENWNLLYQIRGEDKGNLKYSVGFPDCPPILSLEFFVTLPFILRIDLVGNSIYVNGQIHIKDVDVSLHAFPFLFGTFEFHTENQKFFRKVTHRLKANLLDGSADESYFNGDVYKNYEEDASNVSKEIFYNLEKYISGKKTVLDIGCATGLTVEYAISKGFEAEGIDFSSWAVEKANLRTDNKCRVLNFDESSEEDFSKQYDIITLHSVLEHFKYPKKALKLLFQITAPGGIVYIETLNASSMMHLLLKEDWAGYSDYTHQSPWITADWLITEAKDAGFEILSSKRFYLWNDNMHDDVWATFTILFQHYPLKTILEDEFGDLIRIIIRKPLN